MNGLGVFLTIAALFAVAAIFRAVMRREDARDDALYARDERDAHVHVMRLKYGNTWGHQHIRARLAVLHSIIQAIRPHSEYREALGLIGTMTSPAAPLPPLGGAEDAPGTTAAAGNPHPFPPLPPDDLDPSCTYRDEAPFHTWLSDETIARGIPAIKDGTR